MFFAITNAVPQHQKTNTTPPPPLSLSYGIIGPALAGPPDPGTTALWLYSIPQILINNIQSLCKHLESQVILNNQPTLKVDSSFKQDCVLTLIFQQ